MLDKILDILSGTSVVSSEPKKIYEFEYWSSTYSEHFSIISNSEDAARRRARTRMEARDWDFHEECLRLVLSDFVKGGL